MFPSILTFTATSLYYRSHILAESQYSCIPMFTKEMNLLQDAHQQGANQQKANQQKPINKEQISKSQSAKANQQSQSTKRQSTKR